MTTIARSLPRRDEVTHFGTTGRPQHTGPCCYMVQPSIVVAASASGGLEAAELLVNEAIGHY